MEKNELYNKYNILESKYNQEKNSFFIKQQEEIEKNKIIENENNKLLTQNSELMKQNKQLQSQFDSKEKEFKRKLIEYSMVKKNDDIKIKKYADQLLQQEKSIKLLKQQIEEKEKESILLSSPHKLLRRLRPYPNQCSKAIIGVSISRSEIRCNIIADKMNKCIILNDGKDYLPIYIYYNEENTDIKIGNIALEMKNNVIYDIMNLLGLKYEDEYIQNNIKSYKFQIINEKNIPEISIKYDNRMVHISFDKIMTHILTSIKHNSDLQSNENVNNNNIKEGEYKDKWRKCIISFPVSYTKEQKDILHFSAEQAKLDVIQMISEPLSCIIGVQNSIEKIIEINYEKEEYFLVYDFNIDYCDISILNINNNNKKSILMNYKHYNENEISGNRYINTIYEYIIKNNEIIEDKEEENNRISNVKIKTLKDNINNAITYLNTSDPNEYILNCDWLKSDGIKITSNEMNKELSEIFKYIINEIDKLIKESLLKNCDINYIIICSNTFQMKELNNILTTIYTKSKVICVKSEIKSFGCAYYGNNKSNESEFTEYFKY